MKPVTHFNTLMGILLSILSIHLLIHVNVTAGGAVSDSVKTTTEDKGHKTVAQAIIFCSDVNFMKNSTAIRKCTVDIYTEKEATDVFDGNPNLPACLTVRNITQKICHRKSLVTPSVGSSDFEIELPYNYSQFDSDLKKLEPQLGGESKFVVSMCQDIQRLFDLLIADSGDTKEGSHVQYMKDFFFKRTKCGEFCFSSSNKINPLCMTYLWGYNLLKNVPSPETEAIENPEVIATVSKDKLKDANLSHSNNSTNPEKKVSVDLENTNQEQSPKREESVAKPPLVNPQDSDVADEKSIDDTDKQDESVKNDQVSNHEESSIGVPPSLSDPKSKAPEVQASKNFNDKEGALLNEEHGDKVGDNVDDGDNDDSGESPPLPQEEKNSNIYVMKGDEDGSSTMMYWSVITVCIVLFVVYHNKQKIFAIVLEGPSSRRRRGSRRRHTASYHKLDTTLEEAVSSQCTSDVPHVIY